MTGEESEIHFPSFRGVPTGPREARPDDRLRMSYDVQLQAARLFFWRCSWRFWFR